MTNKAAMQMRSRIAVAPMMDWTDRHCRYFLRLLSPSAFLYTEMVTAAEIHHGDAERFLFRRCAAVGDDLEPLHRRERLLAGAAQRNAEAG